MPFARCRQDWTLRFSSREDELVYKRTLQPKVLLAALLWQIAALLVHLLGLVAMVLVEAAEDAEEPAQTTDELKAKRCFFTLHSAFLGVEALVCLLFAGGVGRGKRAEGTANSLRSAASAAHSGAGGRFASCDWELASAASAACVCALLPWLTPLHFGALWGRVPDGLWGVRVQDSESLVLLWLDAMVVWYSISVPVRSSRLWALLLVVWTSVTLLSCFLSAPCPAGVPIKVAAVGVLFAGLGSAAREHERGVRERWLSSFKEEGSPLSRAVAHGMKEMVEAMCDVVLKLTEDLAVVDAEEAHFLFFGRNVSGMALTELMSTADQERFLGMLSRMPTADTPESIRITLLLEAGSLEALLLTVDTGHADARYIVSVSLVRDRPDDVRASSKVSHCGMAEALSYAHLNEGDDGGTVSARDSVVSCPSLAVPPTVVVSPAHLKRSRSCGSSMDLPGYIDEAGESDEDLTEARTTRQGSLSTEDAPSFSINTPTKAVTHLRSSARNGTAGSLAYSEFSEVSAFTSIMPGGRPGGVLSSGELPIQGYRSIGAVLSGDLPPMHRLGGALSGDLPPYLRHRASADRPPGKEAWAQTDPPPPTQDREVSTPATWEEAPFVCTRCGKPPKPPGAPTTTVADNPRARGTARLSSRRKPSRPMGRPPDLPRAAVAQAQHMGQQASFRAQEAPSVERPDVREALCSTSEFDGSWIVWDDSGIVSDWLVRLQIAGTRVVDGLGKRTTLTIQDGHVMLEGGRLTIQDGLLYRTGKSGKSLAFVREELGHTWEAQQAEYEREEEEEEEEAYGDETASDPSWCGTFEDPCAGDMPLF